MEISDKELMELLRKAFVRRGMLIPETEEEVAMAEKMVDESNIKLPDSLKEPPAFVKVESCDECPFIRGSRMTKSMTRETDNTLPSYMQLRKVWKTVGTFDNYKDADKFRKSQAAESKVRFRADGTFDVKVQVTSRKVWGPTR
jgi:hypothetical protein